MSGDKSESLDFERMMALPRLVREPADHSRFIVLGGPLADEHRVVLVIESESEEAVRATLARDPWHDTHLRIDAVDPWMIRLDGRRR